MTKTGNKKRNNSIYLIANDAISKLQLSVLILAIKATPMILKLSLLCPCQTLQLTLAGKQLGAIETATTNFAFAKRYKPLKLEVNPEQP